MKLIYCPVCYGIFSLSNFLKFCVCEKSYGCYLNGIDAVYGGEAIPLGIDNASFLKAINKKDKKDGELFTAFVIPKECETFKKGNLYNENK